MLKSWFLSRCKQLYHLNILILGFSLYQLNVFIFLFCLNHYYYYWTGKKQVSFSSNLAHIKICWAHFRAKINVTLVGCWPVYTAQIQSLSSCTHKEWDTCLTLCDLHTWTTSWLLHLIRCEGSCKVATFSTALVHFSSLSWAKTRSDDDLTSLLS